MRKILLLLIFLYLLGCDNSNEEVETPLEMVNVDAQTKPVEKFEIKKLTPIQLSIGSLEMENDPFYKSNHYGSFYNDQLSCYVIDIPDGKIAGSRVSKVVLFYIDHVLYKKKYILDSNPIEQIKTEIRKYRVKSLSKDLKNVCLEKSNKDCADLIIGQNKFQFFWKKNYLAYDLYCWESSDKKEIILTEERSDYKKALKFAKFHVDINE